MECKKKKGYLKIHIAVVDIKNKKILSMLKVTADEHIHDDKALPELVENIITSDSMTTIGKLFAEDGACDTQQYF